MTPPPRPTTDPPPPLNPQSHLLLVTGRLAEAAVREEIEALAAQHSFGFSVAVMPITVAALMTPRWLTRHLQVPQPVTHVLLPGYCSADSDRLREHLRQQGATVEVLCGPTDCRDLAGWLTGEERSIELTEHSIEIIAEINHVPRRPVDEVLAIAEQLIADGADRIDLGADPSKPCPNIADYVTPLADRGYRISIDTFDPSEAKAAIRAGATLWLSVNQLNRDAAADCGAEVVAIPNTPDDLDSLDQTVHFLRDHHVPFRLDPILEPIGSGFMPSLLRYHHVRQHYPDASMMMGIGNLTELTDVDSAGVNLILLGICQELGIQSVLTTQVINWAQSSVRECDLARRMVHYAVRHGVPPKRLSDELVMLRDPKLRPLSGEALQALADGIRDNNYRLLAQHDAIHLLSAGLHLSGTDPFEIFDRLLQRPESGNVDASHAFYLGYEMAKASLALQLDKQYTQDQALRWGHLTEEENLHRIKRSSRHKK